VKFLRKRAPGRTRSTTGTALDAGDFHVIAEAMPQLVWTADGSGKVDYFNKRWVDYTGLDIAEFLTRGTDVGVVHPDDVAKTWDRWNRAVADGTPYEYEFRLRSSDGSYRWFLTRAAPIRDREGKVARWIGTATDVDEQRRARESLRFMVEAGNAMFAATGVDAICKELARLAVDHFADWCFVTLAEDGRYETVALQHRNAEMVHFVEQYRHRYPPRPGDAFMRAVQQNEAQLYERVLPDQLQAAARDEEHLHLLEFLQMNSLMLLPLTSNGRTYGALTMVSSESGHLFTQSDMDVAGAIAERAAAAIGNARMLAAERQTAERLRFTARISELLFATPNPWPAMNGVAQAIASEIADACGVLRLQEEGIRAEILVHRDPNINAMVGALRGQRIYRPQPEHEIADRLKKHETIVFTNEDPHALGERVWPYLANAAQALAPRTTVILPLHAGSETYGALVVYYAHRAFDGADVPLLEEVAARASVAMEHAHTLERERRIATTLQQASLPSLIPKPAGIRFDTVYAPADEEGQVGGDWYDAIELDDGSVVVSVGDVTGRGIQAAVIMSKVRHAMGAVPRHETDPTKILDSAGWFLAKRYPEAIVTAFVAIVSPDRTLLRFANAGHPLPILWRDGELIELHARGLPLGLRNASSPESSQAIDLRDGDVLVLFTDGLIEGRRDWDLGERLLRQVLCSGVLTASVSPAKIIARACLPPEVHDDVAILTVSLGPGPAWTFSADDARAAVDARALFVEFLHEAHGDDEFVDRAELVFGELLGNVVRHAPGPVEVSFERGNGGGVLHLIDSGTPFSLMENHLPDDAFSDFGRGLFIVQHLASDLRVEHVPNCGNHIRVTL
jgi:PAS domain S-box-containing protein